MDVIIIGNPWHFSADNPTGKHHIALELCAQGHRVLWINSAGMRNPSVGSDLDRNRIMEKIRLAFRGIMRIQERLWVISPLIIPLPTLGLARGINSVIYFLCAMATAARLGFRRPLLMSFFVMVPGVLKLWPWTSVYYLVDRWNAFSRYDSRVMSRMNRLSCINADCVIVSARHLFEDVKSFNPRTHLVSHGVDYEHFAAAVREKLLRPVDLPEGKVIGFFGLLSEWIDQDLLVRLARKVPAVHIVLIGKADVEVSKLKAETNIVILGAKQFSELPQYAAHFDVGIIPFVINDLTRAVNPIKLREMLAAGCPVVSTALPEVIGARDQVAMDAGSDGQVLGRRTGIWVAHNHEEFFAHTLYLLEHPVTLDERKAVSERMSSETWPGKVHEILRLSLRAESAKQ